MAAAGVHGAKLAVPDRQIVVLHTPHLLLVQPLDACPLFLRAHIRLWGAGSQSSSSLTGALDYCIADQGFFFLFFVGVFGVVLWHE